MTRPWERITAGNGPDDGQWADSGTVSTMTDSGSVTVFTDGAAKGNPGPAGWAWWIAENAWQSGGWERATNNVAELTAVLKALQALQHRRNVSVTIVTDSQYVQNCLTRYIHGWRRNGWQTAARKPVANAELIREIDQLIQARGGVTWVWQRGHVGAHGNTQADARASAAAEAWRAGRKPNGGPALTLHPLGGT